MVTNLKFEVHSSCEFEKSFEFKNEPEFRWLTEVYILDRSPRGEPQRVKKKSAVWRPIKQALHKF
jgi:hypothetical protein